MLADRPDAPTPFSAAVQGISEFQTTDSYADAGLRLDTFDLGDTSEFLMDDLWFLNVPPLDLDGQVLH
jgi:hypothetical protein